LLVFRILLVGGHRIMGPEVQRTKYIYGDFAVEPEPIETNCGDLLAVLIEDANLYKGKAD
jgi:hypothetical protein